MPMLRNWTRFEKIWLVTFGLLILAATVTFSLSGTNYNSTKSILLNWVVSPLSAITGIVCVVLVAKGSIRNYAWGVVNCITYGYLAYESGYYGDMILNLFYFLPFQFIGFIWWKKRLKEDSKTQVRMQKLTVKQMLVIAAAGVTATIGFGLLLFNVDHWFSNVMKRNVSIYAYLDQIFHIPYLGAIFDASTEILQITAQVLMALAYAEQWIMWILTNIITIIMWGTVIAADKTTVPWALPTLIMWMAYLVNSFYGYVNWLRGVKEVN
jgi:nicotinamide mononucleotide transporter